MSQYKVGDYIWWIGSTHCPDRVDVCIENVLVVGVMKDSYCVKSPSRKIHVVSSEYLYPSKNEVLLMAIKRLQGDLINDR